MTTLIFLVKTIKKDEEVHIVYPGSARGDNILICCEMFPNTIWYLIDPNRFNEKLYNHPQINRTRDRLEQEEEQKTQSLRTNESLLRQSMAAISQVRMTTNRPLTLNKYKRTILYFLKKLKARIMDIKCTRSYPTFIDLK